MLTSSAGGRATNKALQLLLSSNVCRPTLLLGQIAAAFVHSHATANVTTGACFISIATSILFFYFFIFSVFMRHRTNIDTIPVMRFTSLCP